MELKDLKNVRDTFEPGDVVLFIDPRDRENVKNYGVVEEKIDGCFGNRVIRWSNGHLGTSFENTVKSDRHINLGPLTEKEKLVMMIKYGISV